jgi:hypothetical protein
MPTARGADAAPIDELLPPNCGPSSQQLAALDAAVAAAFPAFGSLAPNDSADIKGRRHAYLNLPGLLEAVRPALMAQQVIIANTISIVPGGFVVSTMLRHSGGGWRLSQFPVLSLTSSSAISAAATSGFRVNLQLLLGICASDEDAAHDAAPAAAPAPWEQPAPAAPTYAAPPPQPAPQQQPWAAPAPQGGYDMTRAIPQHEAAALVAAAQQQQPNALQYQPTPTDPSAYV